MSEGYKVVIPSSNNSVAKELNERPIPYELRPSIENNIPRLVKEGVSIRSCNYRNFMGVPYCYSSQR